jgi:hypothetical protein
MTLDRSPSIPIAPRYLVSKEEIPIKGEGYSFATADRIKRIATTIRIAQIK